MYFFKIEKLQIDNVKRKMKYDKKVSEEGKKTQIDL